MSEPTTTDQAAQTEQSQTIDRTQLPLNVRVVVAERDRDELEQTVAYLRNQNLQALLQIADLQQRLADAAQALGEAAQALAELKPTEDGEDCEDCEGEESPAAEPSEVLEKVTAKQATRRRKA